MVFLGEKHTNFKNSPYSEKVPVKRFIFLPSHFQLRKWGFWKSKKTSVATTWESVNNHKFSSLDYNNKKKDSAPNSGKSRFPAFMFDKLPNLSTKREISKIEEKICCTIWKNKKGAPIQIYTHCFQMRTKYEKGILENEGILWKWI